MFTDRLTTTLSLSVGSEVHALSAGQIERFSLDLHSWGFAAEVTFYVSSEQQPDPVFAGFRSTSLLCVQLQFARAAEGEGDAPSGVSVTGYAISKAVSEVVAASLHGAPVIGRRYELHMVDAAQAFWTQHRPLELHVRASLKDMLEANKPTGVTVRYDWPAAMTAQDVLTVGLDGEAEPSFYDFLMHWVDRNQGVFELDAAANTYRLGAKKSVSASASAQSSEDVAALRLCFPEPPRFVARVLQAFADAPMTKELSNALAAGIRRDVLLRTPIAADVNQRAQLETARLRTRAPGIELSYRRCPDVITPPLGYIELGEDFSERLYAAGTTYRVTRLRASARHKADVPVEPEDDSSVYEIELSVEAEDKLSAVACLPPFRDPRRTLRVEGKIVSAGQSGQRTWAALENEDNSLWMYKVFIPLFNKEVPAPFAPNFATGHFFFPAYKDQRVLVDLEFDRAFITGFLDWADEGRLPSDTQGSQIVMGLKANNGTVIRHSYQDAIPVLNVERKASIETTTLTLGDGKLHIGLEQSSAVPTSIPLYDVSPQVEAAKDAVIAEVGGSVNVVTTQFQTAAGEIAGSIEDTSATVQTEVSAAERTLTAQLDAAENELQGLLADASGAGASLALGAQRCKARLQAALQSADAVRAPLLALKAQLASTRQSASLELKALEAEITSLPAILSTPFDAASLQASALRDRAKVRFASLESSIANLRPRANAGVFADLTRFRQSLQGLSADVAATRAELEGRVSAFVGEATREWAAVDAKLAAASSTGEQSLEAAIVRLRQDLTRTQAQLSIKQRATKPEQRSALQALAARLASLQTSLAPSAEQERTRLRELLSSVRTGVAQGRTQLEQTATVGASGVKSATTNVSAGAQQALAGVDRLGASLESTAEASATQLESALTQLKQAIMAVLDAVPPGIDSAKKTMQATVASAVTSCHEGLAGFDRLLADLESSVRVPLDAALQALDAAEAAAEQSVTAASKLVDDTLGSAQRTLDGLVSTFGSLVDGAHTALAAVRSLVSGTRGQVMPPIDALVSLVEQLQATFQSGVNVLTAFVDKAHAALEAIPAASLPKAAVQPAITAIGAALDAVLPVIQAAAKSAGDQLGSLGTALASQVQSAEKSALSLVSTLVDTLDKQIEAVLPPVREQLATVQQQIDQAIEQVLTQVDQTTTLAVDGITQTFTAAGQQAQSIAQAAEAELARADAQLRQLAADARAQLARQRDALSARAGELLGQISSSVDGAAARLDATGKQLDDQLSLASRQLQAQLASGLAPLDAQLDGMRAQLRALPGTLSQQLARATAENHTRVQDISSRVPKDADITAGVSAALQPLNDAASRLQAELAAL